MGKQYYCKNCGNYFGKPKVVTKGSIVIELILWLCFLVPGLIYTLWRMTSGRSRVCPACSSDQIIPASSPLAKSKPDIKQK